MYICTISNSYRRIKKKKMRVSNDMVESLTLETPSAFRRVVVILIIFYRFMF